MFGVLGIMFLAFVFVQYIGNEIKTNNSNSLFKQRAQKRGWNVWYDGQARARDIINDHYILKVRDEKFGLMRKDLQTGRIYYDAIDDLIYRFNHKQISPNYEDNMYREKLAPSGRTVFVDCNTGQICVLTCAYCFGDSNFEDPCAKTDTWFYADFWDNSIVRKTTKQINKDNQLKERGLDDKIYSLEDLKRYKEKNYVSHYMNGDWIAHFNER